MTTTKSNITRAQAQGLARIALSRQKRKLGEQAYRDEHRKALADGASGEVAHERAIAAQIAIQVQSSPATSKLIAGHKHPITGEPVHQEQNTTTKKEVVR